MFGKRGRPRGDGDNAGGGKGGGGGGGGGVWTTRLSTSLVQCIKLPSPVVRECGTTAAPVVSRKNIHLETLEIFKYYLHHHSIQQRPWCSVL